MISSSAHRRALRAAATLLCLLALPSAAGASVGGPGARCRDVVIRMADGIRLHGWVVFDPSKGRRPVLWTMTPYSNSTCPTSAPGVEDDIATHVNLARISLRGTGGSEGLNDGFGQQDRRDVGAVARFLAREPWARGLVPVGFSAEGAWMDYALALPQVKAAVWGASCADGYRDCVRIGGELGGGQLILATNEQQGLLDGQAVEQRLGLTATPFTQQQAALNGFINALGTHTLLDRFWKQRLGVSYLQGIHVPVLYTTDVYDYAPGGMYLAYLHTPRSVRYLSLGAGHNSPFLTSIANSKDPALARFRGLTYRSESRFLAHYVLGRNNGAQRDPHVTLVTNLGSVHGYTTGHVLIRRETAWPLPETRWTQLFLSGAGPAQSHTQRLTHRPPRGSNTLTIGPAPGPLDSLRLKLLLAQQSHDQQTIDALDDVRNLEAGELTYTTPRLAHNVEITGPIVLTLYARSAARDFDWHARLTDVHPDGRSSFIADGLLRAAVRQIAPAQSLHNAGGDLILPWYPFTHAAPVPSDATVKYTITIEPTSNVFSRGDRIRLDVGAVASPGPTGEQGVGTVRVIHDRKHPSAVLLPVIPGRCQKGAAGASGIRVPKSCGLLGGPTDR